MDAFAWSIVLFTIGMLLVVLELFVPSGGALSVLAGLSLLASIAAGFAESGRMGAVMFVVTTIALPLIITAMARVWPKTRFGRRMVSRPDSADVLPDTEHHRRMHALVGQFGRAKSKMLPSGSISIAGQTYDAVSEGMPIEIGQFIRVVTVRGNHIVVRPVDRIPTAADAEQDLLSQPLDSMGLESLDDLA